jgi:hypothetical protein
MAMKESFTDQDIQLIRSKMAKAWGSLARTYMPFVLALLVAYFYARPRATRRAVSFSAFDKVYVIVFIFFIGVFALFFLKEYNKSIALLKKEIVAGEKNLSLVCARKYFDPIYKQYLLYHPFKENTYFIVSEEIFNSIQEGQEIELQTGIYTGIVLAVKVNNKLLPDIEEFRFS